jgi:hypothetical protein
MAKPDLKRGDAVVFTRAWRGTIKKGTTGTITRVYEVCEDYHKCRYEWVVDLKIGDSHWEEIEHDHLEKADAITRLGGITD